MGTSAAQRDVLLGVFSLNDTTVAEVMTRNPETLTHHDKIAFALNKMHVGGFRHIPIVEDGRPTAVVSARDVFRHLAQSLR